MLHKIVCSECFSGVRDIKQVMRNSFHLAPCDLAGTDIKLFVDLSRICGNNLTIELLGEFHTQGTFA